MTRYLVLHNSSVSAQELMKSAGSEKYRTSVNDWKKLSSDNKAIDIESGAPLHLVGRVISGRLIASNSQVTGYSIIEGKSEDEVISILQTHPHLDRADASFDVFETAIT